MSLSSDPVLPTRWLLRVFAPSALLLGIAMLLRPLACWSLLGLDAGSDGVVATLYASVLAAIGIVSFLALRDPYRHASLLLVIAVYKTFVTVFLLLRAFGVLGAPAGLPPAGWAIAGIYLGLAAICGWCYRGLSMARDG